jgi:Deoxyribonuclease II
MILPVSMIHILRKASLILMLALLPLAVSGDLAGAADAPVPLLKKGEPVDWWFVYKFNSKNFPACGAELKDDNADRDCPFGGVPGPYGNSQQFVVANKNHPALDPDDAPNTGCAGTTDPIATTFEQIYNGNFRYLIWNDQFYQDPKISACSSNSCGGPWGHSKGMLAWNEEGEGVVIQVTTPSWPGVGNEKFKRKAGNTLGCIKKPNNILFGQHFFALKLSKNDTLKVLTALENASVVTDTDRLELVNVGGSPKEIKDLVAKLGTRSDSTEVMEFELDSGVRLISKPSALHVPPWQMLSAKLGSVDLKAATWWASPQIPTTTSTKKIGCWDDSLDQPGAVEIAVTGHWGDEDIGLVGSQNHGKIGVTTSGKDHLSIFADLNQQGSLTGNCKSSQNGRGGLFYIVKNEDLFDSMTKLLKGKVAPTTTPKKINASDD